MRSRALRPAMAAALVAILAGACSTGTEPAPTTQGFSETAPDGMNGAVLTDRYRLPGRVLTATDGTPYDLRADTTAPVTLVFFGYTNCPDICHVVMADIASALTRLDEQERRRVDMLLITSDPARDDPATLRAYLDRFNPRFEGLTGDLGRIVTVAEALGVPIEDGARLPSGGYEVTHGTQIIAVDEQDRVPIVWTEGTSAADIAEDLRVMLRDGLPS